VAIEKTMNPWSYKPWWCQPWSILLTGSSLIAASWWTIHQLWFTVLVAIPVGVWMGFFLLVWPSLMAQVLADMESTEDGSGYTKVQ
jgi:hypothetical protein